MNSPLNWEDLRIILEISRNKNLSLAAKNLGVNQTTVSRRLYALEEQIGSKLFEQIKNGPRPTKACMQLLKVAEKTEKRLLGFEAKKIDQRKETSILIRLTTLDILACLYAKELNSFCEKYPQYSLEIISCKEALDMSRREADISLRFMGEEIPQDLEGKNYGRLGVSVYTSSKTQSIKDLGNNWIASKSKIPRPLEDYIFETDRTAKVTIRDNSLIFRAKAINEGLGIGILPTIYGDSIEGIKRTGPLIRDLEIYLWLVTHKSIAHSSKIKCFMDYFSKNLGKDIRKITGE